MNIFTKNRMLVGAVILLAALNLAILGTVFFQRKPIAPPPTSFEADRMPRHSRMIAMELNLSPEQEAKLEELRKVYAKQTQDNKISLRDHYRMIMRELSAEIPNEHFLDSVAIEIGRLHMEQQRSTIEHFLTLREVCSFEQYEKLQQIFKRRMFSEPRRDMEQRRQQMNLRRQRSERSENETD
jgi:Spy/CpxP family protein refolding chaperone